MVKSNRFSIFMLFAQIPSLLFVQVENHPVTTLPSSNSGLAGSARGQFRSGTLVIVVTMNVTRSRYCHLQILVCRAAAIFVVIPSEVEGSPNYICTSGNFVRFLDSLRSLGMTAGRCGHRPLQSAFCDL